MDRPREEQPSRNSLYRSKPNVYQTLVLVRLNRYLRPIGFHPLFWPNRSCERTAFRFQESRKAMNERQPIPVYEWKNSHSPADAEPIAIAERELGAFIRAVTELFGSEQARLAAADWVDELELMDALPGPASSEWRSVTVAASARLARRLTNVDHPTPRVALD
jgi:hypothetical protein